ncbi:uncharacterized protein LOC116766296 isoform X2 [Danaus plexippus]|nr:uncharacterized protein LOC116766296 isoform X2 [Danaus plexippus]
MSQEDIDEYSNSIKRLKNESTITGISEEEFTKMYFQSLNELNRERLKKSNRKTNTIFVIPILVIFFITIAYNYKFVYSCLICNMQEYIYPGLRLLRKISIPFVALFPSLTEFYQETCLIQNPFFTVVDMDCWPCSSIHTIREISNPLPIHTQQSAPFVYKTKQHSINFDDIKKLYINNRDLFDKESPKILVNNNYYVSPRDVFKSDLQNKDLFIWKFNNFNVARLLRQIIPRPKVVPKFGQSTERFIIMDFKQDKYKIPDTECNNSFLLTLKGSRIVELKPAEECKHECKSFKLELKESYLLWYNWWYWRPVVQQSSSNETFIAHVGSYC